jgi:hypothetical protein
MNVGAWFSRLFGAINNEYERRIRAASEVTEYGAHHGHAGHGEAAHHHDDDEGEIEIMNVPRGTRVRPDAEPEDSTHPPS